MGPSEFELIDRWFAALGAARRDVALGVGDDAALLDVPPDRQLVAAIDTLVEGVHFPRGSPPESIGHRALAVNLSDLAAMGAEPAWALLALTLSEVRADWLDGFAAGFGALARAHGLALVGGDTTSGPLTISVQVLGLVPRGAALRRDRGRAGDAVYVSGTPGDAAAGLELELAASSGQDQEATLRRRFLFPEPRVALGQMLRGRASACIDVSDGLLGDAAKLARASGCGLRIDAARLPISAALMAYAGRRRALELALGGGDDYELAFALPPEVCAAVEREAAAAGLGIRRIGELLTEAHCSAIDADGSVIDVSSSGFEHFAARGTW